MLNKVLLLALLVSITAIADDPLAELKSAAILAEQSGLPEVFATCSGTLLAMAEIAKDARKKRTADQFISDSKEWEAAATWMLRNIDVKNDMSPQTAEYWSSHTDPLIQAARTEYLTGWEDLELASPDPQEFEDYTISAIVPCQRLQEFKTSIVKYLGDGLPQ